jgi:hypothetical protein
LLSLHHVMLVSQTLVLTVLPSEVTENIMADTTYAIAIEMTVLTDLQVFDRWLCRLLSTLVACLQQRPEWIAEQTRHSTP